MFLPFDPAISCFRAELMFRIQILAPSDNQCMKNTLHDKFVTTYSLLNGAVTLVLRHSVDMVCAVYRIAPGNP
jgi:hypothetical protein